MAMPGIRFVEPRAPQQGLHVRADVALFAGLIRLRSLTAGVIPEWIMKQWQALGLEADVKAEHSAIFQLPVRLESVAQFDAIFEDCRPLSAAEPNLTLPTALGLAVRAFFAEGGIACYVVRCGDPLPLLGDASEISIESRRQCLHAIIPGPLATSELPNAWRGIEHVLGLEDVSMVLLPDLPELFASSPSVLLDTYVPPPVTEVFRPADQSAAADRIAASPARIYSAPRLDAAGRTLWCAAVGNAVSLLDRGVGGISRRDVQLILALPLPPAGASNQESELGIRPLLADENDARHARLQYTYPWVETSFSSALPEGLQSSDGVVAGILARNALTRGAYKSAAGLPSLCVEALSPKLTASALGKTSRDAEWLGDGITVLGLGQSGFVLLSDSTASDQAVTRAASLRRLQGIVLRAGRIAGQDLVFEGNLPSTWTRLRHRLEDYLTELWQLGAFDGASAQEAFEVRCGPSTMSQNDIDAGRMVAEISFAGMQPIERLTITLEFNPQQSASLRAA